MSGTCSICSNCQSCESFCENSKQLVKLHKPSVTIDGGEILPDQIIIKRFTRADLNSIAKAIVEAGKKGSEQCSNDELEWEEETSDFIRAKAMNDLRDLMDDLYSGNSVPSKVNEDQVITAAWFEDLRIKLSELELDPDACNECNTSCDTCVTCQHSSCHSSCHTSAPSGGGT